MTDMTINAVRTTMIRVPWPDTPWLKGHAFGEARNLLVLEVETKGGIVGMGYLFSFRPGLKTVVAALEETILPHVIGKDATAVEGIWNDLLEAHRHLQPRRHRHHGDVGARHRAVGRHRQARQHAAASAVGPCALDDCRCTARAASAAPAATA